MHNVLLIAGLLYPVLRFEIVHRMMLMLMLPLPLRCGGGALAEVRRDVVGTVGTGGGEKEETIPTTMGPTALTKYWAPSTDAATHTKWWWW